MNHPHPQRLSKLYFKHIHRTELETRGVTIDDLAKNLAEHGLIEILGEGFFRYLPNPKGKAFYFKTVWGTQAANRPPSHAVKLPLFLCLLIVTGLLQFWLYPLYQFQRTNSQQHRPSQQQPFERLPILMALVSFDSYFGGSHE